MTIEELNAIKEFAEHNWCLEEDEQLYVDDTEFAVSNPWMDHSGRFALTDDGAVREWGLDVVVSFIEMAKAVLNGKLQNSTCIKTV